MYQRGADGALTLLCDMERDCDKPITHIDEKGYIYCEGHGEQRKAYKRCRKLRAWELNLLKQGKPVPSYEPISYKEAVDRMNKAAAKLSIKVGVLKGETG